MPSSFGDSVRVNIFGGSHGEAIGVAFGDLLAGRFIDEKQLALQMARHAPGRDLVSTSRSEGDRVRIVSGLLNGKTTGAPLYGMIENTNTCFSDYESLRVLPCPGHAGYTGAVRYNGASDVRGGGYFSGRLTVPLTFAGVVRRQILSAHEIRIGAYALRIASVTDTVFDPVEVPDALLERLSTEYFSPIDRSVEAAMQQEIEAARKSTDSVGGVVECAVTGVPAGIGSPTFYGMENVLSSILLGVPAIKGVEFGDGFVAASLHGSENNDAFTAGNGQVKTHTNHYGGILSGITTGMSLILRAAFKPTPSTGQEQNTVNLNTLQNESSVVHGRHDPRIVSRVIPVVEAAVAVGLVNLMAERGRP